MVLVKLVIALKLLLIIGELISAALLINVPVVVDLLNDRLRILHLFFLLLTLALVLLFCLLILLSLLRLFLVLLLAFEALIQRQFKVVVDSLNHLVPPLGLLGQLDLQNSLLHALKNKKNICGCKSKELYKLVENC